MMFNVLLSANYIYAQELTRNCQENGNGCFQGVGWKAIPPLDRLLLFEFQPKVHGRSCRPQDAE